MVTGVDGRERARVWDAAALEARVVRYRDLIPCTNAFIDTRTPGSDAKENFTIIGPGVAENPEQHVHIAEAHGFNIGGARQPPACINSQHSHDTAEVFVVHTGHWRFTFGEHGEDAQVDAGPGDIVSFPVRAFRGFENIGDARRLPVVGARRRRSGPGPVGAAGVRDGGGIRPGPAGKRRAGRHRAGSDRPARA